MAYIPDELIVEDWASPISIIGTDAISQLDEAVNDIITLDPASMVNFINAQMAKIPPYLTIELEKIYAETAVHAGVAQASAAAALVSENKAKASETAAAGSENSAASHASTANGAALSATNSASAAAASEAITTPASTAATNAAAAAAISENNSATNAAAALDAATRAEQVDAGKAVLSETAGITAIQVLNEVVMLDTDYDALVTKDPNTIYNLYEV